jgi:hypothetical protein
VSGDKKKKRNRVKQSLSLDERLKAETAELRERLASLPHGPERDDVMRRLRQNETASRITDWLSSPGLKPPA